MGSFYEYSAPVTKKVWLRWQDPISDGAPQSFTLQPSFVSTFNFANVVNDLASPTSNSSAPPVAGFSTLRRMYKYYRAYKFKPQWRIDFKDNNVDISIWPQTFYIFTVPTFSPSAPWTTFFALAFDVRYMIETSRKIPFMTCKRYVVNTQAGKNYVKVKGATTTLKSLLGFNPPHTFDSAGGASALQDSLTVSSPTMKVYYHVLVVNEIKENIAMPCNLFVTRDYSTKCIFFGRNTFNSDSSADASV